ncbi:MULTISPECIES: LysR family transcriptional regulator [unclassified Chelatococcus]|uniref:LysR family transcriptional regulator n=1 Tax=unclassified Chelatococcus TaxID=2638111 RepID=UPI001BCE1999|nr:MULTISPECIES: LysR family transcriptional regulator [unclassified Chelatococcus]CAH1655024.1 LysR family transcriptional regulator [Hyphomicrobiales bacterium]MBS7742707.1 LysR family transcriptional regulator [Chelatococcus sp. HY11]MBX3542175.1 LysR family transcriptional regulator [Chelatococcus sp.]MCO5075609.1 LysR family transcriptional regulator [Chelatococcus sp.]CAH1695223.1 LysR family transcriptional regulator [Hyphomicrobiales bacterium]
MEWSDVRIFLAIARTGSLGAAARALNLSHPTVGRRLRALEHATGQTLFQRTADGFVPTEEGAAVITLAEQMEEGALAMERRLAGQEQKLQGSLRISSADWFGAYVLPPIIADYVDAYPLVDVEILTGTRLFSLAQREADIAFRIVPFDTPDIVQRRLVRLAYGAYVGVGSPEPAFGDGTGFRLITHDTSTGQFPDITWLEQSFPNARTVLRSNNRNVQGRMAYQGIGIAVLPQVVGDQLAGLRRLDLPEEPPGRDIWMGYHRDIRRLHRLRAFIDTVNRHIGKLQS